MSVFVEYEIQESIKAILKRLDAIEAILTKQENSN